MSTACVQVWWCAPAVLALGDCGGDSAGRPGHKAGLRAERTLPSVRCTIYTSGTALSIGPQETGTLEPCTVALLSYAKHTCSPTTQREDGRWAGSLSGTATQPVWKERSSVWTPSLTELVSCFFLPLVCFPPAVATIWVKSGTGPYAYKGPLF